MMTSPKPRLSPRMTEEDRAALARSADDLSDIDPERLKVIDERFAAAYERAEEIGNGTRNPLWA
ncbi:hypothetical protein SEA_JACKSPARROW_85 [Mycobacterium phage JackSparrow]|nr:hypothetical protein SEA_JACKSPARROW_85 [Mycobacterium phage JackSparrow]